MSFLVFLECRACNESTVAIEPTRTDSDTEAVQVSLLLLLVVVQQVFHLALDETDGCFGRDALSEAHQPRIRAHEEANRARKTVLGKLDRLAS